MNILIHLALICLHAVLYISASCDEAKQLESTCGTYCFQAIRPVLEHTKTLQHKVYSNEVEQNSEVGDNEKLLQKINFLEEKLIYFVAKFERIEYELLDKLDIVDQQMKAYLKLGNYQKIGQKYYAIFSNERASWLDANDTCKILGGYLACPQNEDELKALREYTANNRYWIGILRSIDNGFIYSTTEERAKFLSWGENEPNNANDNENCVELINLNSKFVMNDNACKRTLAYICEQQ